MIKENTHPDRCEACGELFMDAHAQGSKIRHEHHLIPRAYGGSNGPTVDICNEDHDLLHLLAVKVIHNSLTLDEIPSRCDGPNHALAITNMVYYVVEAERRTRNDPNKKTLVSVSLSGKQARMLDTITKTFNTSGRQNTLIRLIEMEYQKSIPSKSS